MNLTTSPAVLDKLPRKDVIGVPVTHAAYQAIVDRVIALAQRRQPAYVCVAAVHLVVEAFLDAGLRAIVEAADMVTADGKPVAVALGWLHKTSQERVAGMDLMPSVMAAAERAGCSVFFWAPPRTSLRRRDASLNANSRTSRWAGTFLHRFVH